MKYFWHFVLSIGVLAVILFSFFGASLSFGDNVRYTDATAITEPSVTFIDPVLGSELAPVTIVTYGDYGCDACADLDKTLLSLVVDTFPADLRLVWKDMPNVSQHPEALNAATAARCAGEQNKFWEYHTALMANHTILGAELYTTIAEGLELKAKSFASCMRDETPAPIIQQTFEEGLALQVSSTPTMFINGVRYTGAVDLGTLKAIIRQALVQ